MKFTCITEQVRHGLSAAERFNGKNTTLPILANVLMEVDGNTLKLITTNLESGIQVVIHGNGGSSGRVCVPIKVLSSFLQSVNDEKIQIEEKQGNLLVTADLRTTRINGVPADDFPLLPKITKSESFQIDAVSLKNGLEKVLPAVSASEFKPELSGVYIGVSPTQVKFAATDTFRLAEKTVTLDEKYKNKSFSFIMPHRIAQEIIRVIGDDEEVTISMSENQALIETDGLMIVSRLVEGNFPDYGGIIPKNFETSCHVSRTPLVSAVRASSIFASKLQDVMFNTTAKAIDINSSNQDVGEYINSLPCSIAGKETSVSFNCRYLLDGLQSLDEDDVFVGFNGKQGPTLLRNKADGSFLYVVMPIRIA